MDIIEKMVEGVVVLRFKGKLDQRTASDALLFLSELIDSGRHKLLLNLSELEYISSAGLRVLIAAAKRLKAIEGGEIVLSCLSGNVLEVFEISGFINIFAIFESDQQAIAHLKS